MYRRLAFEEREEISRLLSWGCGIRAIGRQLGRSPSTISREVRRTQSYRAISGQRVATKCASSRRLGKRVLANNRLLAREVFRKLRLRWFPDQIAQFLRAEYDDRSMHVCGETIYTYIYVLPRGRLKKELSRAYVGSTRNVGGRDQAPRARPLT